MCIYMYMCVEVVCRLLVCEIRWGWINSLSPPRHEYSLIR